MTLFVVFKTEANIILFSIYKKIKNSFFLLFIAKSLSVYQTISHKGTNLFISHFCFAIMFGQRENERVKSPCA
jgi:hypothetical protein